MSDLQVLLRHAKRSKDSKLDLAGKGISYIPNQIFSLEHLEILILSGNQLTSIDTRIQSLAKLKILDLSNNSIMDLPVELLKLTSLQALNLTGNPLYNKFDRLLQKDASIAPQLKSNLEKCFGLSAGEEEKPSWLESKDTSHNTSEKAITKMVEFESLYKNEQQKVKQLERELEKLSFAHNPKDSGFKHDDQVLQIPVNDIEFFEQISMGGFSVIHRANYAGCEVAVKKVFNPNITEELLAEMGNEVSMLSKFRHPNIVLMLGICSVPPKLCIVMENIQEGSLYDLLFKRKQELKEEERKKVIKQIVSALYYLHSHHIVHRDIKSHNFLVDRHLNVKLCDFGLARNKDDLNKGAMQFSGTPIYMSQELFQKKVYTSSIDVFALGTLIYEIYTREIPYNGLDPADIKEKILKDSSLPSRNSISKSVLNLVNQCRHAEPNKRPSMQQIFKFSEW